MCILLRVLGFSFYAGHRTKRESQMDMIDDAEGWKGVDLRDNELAFLCRF